MCLNIGFYNPLFFFAISITLFIILIYRRIGLGISLTLAAVLMSFLSLGIDDTVTVLFNTCLDHVTLTVVFASFFIILLSILYTETKLVNVLTKSITCFAKNSNVVVSLLPAIMGLLPVAGGALMSAPMIETESDKMGFDESKKAYINIWFRHLVTPIYPLSQFVIITAALTGTAIYALIGRQALVIIVMIITGYVVGLRKTKESKDNNSNPNLDIKHNLERLLYSFSPIIVTIILTTALNLNIAISTFLGVISILIITKIKVDVIKKIWGNRLIWEVPLAAFGALLLRNVTEVSGASQILSDTLVNMNLNEIIVLLIIPFILGIIVSSPAGTIALCVPILAETVTFTPVTVGLFHISAFFGYLIAPTHLCVVLSAQYFRSSLSKLYKYLIPSATVSIFAALITYYLI